MAHTDDIDSGRLSESSDRSGRFLRRREGMNQGPVMRRFASESSNAGRGEIYTHRSHVPQLNCAFRTSDDHLVEVSRGMHHGCCGKGRVELDLAFQF